MLRRSLTRAATPADGAAVMGTGIVSVAVARAGSPALSEALMWIALALWAALALVLAARAAVDRTRLRREAAMPASLTGVAGTCVLGARLAQFGWRPAGIALLVLGAALWVALLGPVLRAWSTPTDGASFLLAVSTQALAALAFALAGVYSAGWLVAAGLAAFVLGLAAYAFVAARFDLHELVNGAGDQWVAGGALAISALACASGASVARATGTLAALRPALGTLSAVVWGLAMAWLPALLAAEAVRPRLRYDVRRWATVFPLGMYAAMSFGVGKVEHAGWIDDFARAWTWVALAVWAVVFAAALKPKREAAPEIPGPPLSRQPPPAGPASSSGPSGPPRSSTSCFRTGTDR